ncbi:MAG TPA: DUF1287 domain-containing protein [Ignavibacteria bacterium]|nr:DUF1287 domain-containing protein [Ignavibacteria bacterium]HRF66202.1 DUF1287 domain-containing protein [Ignavibacteria bacterium]HRJ03852.1 DUF1287 domain-containing protein [Ignavibacteria bacterium]
MKLILLLISFVFIFSCSKQEVKSDNTNKTVNKTDSTLLNKTTLTENQKKVLDGAKKCLEAKFSYDMTMGYYVCTYKDGENTGSRVFPGGDVAPDMGVCTDVIVRALRWGGVCDLQEEINNDLKANWSDYPMKRWSAKKPDPNIDQRRVPVQMVWFEKYWQEINPEKESDFQPGDVVAWDMNGDGWGDHIGIVSDKIVNGVPYLIHNFPDPGYVAEEDVLHEWNILGVYRVK